jgi:hypothetical protein
MFVLEIKSIRNYVMKQIIIFLFAITSVFAQSQFKTEDIISTQDKLRFLDSLNKYRELAGVKPLEYSFQEDSLAKYRTSTIFNHLDSISEEEYKSNITEHQHHSFFEDIIKYESKHIHVDTVVNWSAECSARLSKYNQPDDMVNELFQGWKNSKAHWSIMLDSRFEYIVFDWFCDNQRHIRERKGTIASIVLFSKKLVKSKRGVKNSP